MIVLLSVIFSLLSLYIMKKFKIIYKDSGEVDKLTAPLYVWILFFILCFIPILNILFYLCSIIYLSYIAYGELKTNKEDSIIITSKIILFNIRIVKFLMKVV